MAAQLDSTDLRLLELLAANSRVSLRAIGARIGLSAPAVRDRLRRLEDDGVISSFTIAIDPKALGYTLEAVVRIEALPGRLRGVEQAIRDIPEITGCDMVTGEDCYIARLALRGIEDLDRLLGPLHGLARTSSAIVKRVAIERRPPPFVAG